MKRSHLSWRGLLILMLISTCSAAGVPRGANGHGAAEATISVRSTLPAAATAKALLNTTHRHGEWLRVPAGSESILAWIVYPDRSDKAPVALITANDQTLTDWLRAVADQVALEGYIAVVPDALSSTAGVDIVRDHAARLPPANRVSVRLSFVSTPAVDARIDILVDDRLGDARKARFPLSEQAWPAAVTFLNSSTDNNPVLMEMPSHAGHLMGQAAPQTPSGGAPAGGRRGYPTGKPDHLIAGFFNAKSTVESSPMRSEWVDIPVAGVMVRTRIVYPDGIGQAPVVVAMQHGTGLDDWMLALADQLAREGFIAIAPDLHSGFGPNAGNTDAFEFIDDVMKANAEITTEIAMERFKAAYAYGLELPRANGRSASIGFCRGGGHSFRFAAEVPLDAAVVFYGGAPEPNVMEQIEAPVIGFYGEDDVRITSTVEGTAADMQRLGKSYEYHIYPHATHVFLEFQDLGGNPEAVAHAWPRAMAFIREHTMQD